MSTLRIIRITNPADLQGFIEEIKYMTRQKEVAGPQRASFRFRYKLPMTIDFEYAGSRQQKRVNASMENISTEGISFLSPWQFDPGQSISLTVESREVFYRAESTVVYSTPYVDSYKTGARFNLVTQPEAKLAVKL